LKAQIGGARIEVVVHDPADFSRAAAVLARHGDGEIARDAHVRRLTVPTSGGAERVIQVARDFETVAIAIDEIALRRPTLDDVFLALTGHAAETSPAAGDAPAANPEARRNG
jgi:ABC-2 type transport system ATP-binding protein